MGNRECNVRWRPAGSAAVVCIMLAAAYGSVLGDKIVLTNGSTYNGKLLKRTATTVRFHVVLSNGAKVALDFPAGKVKSVTVGGDTGLDTVPPKIKKPTPTKPPGVKPPTATGSKGAKRSPAAVNALVQREGKPVAPWWDSVKLDYPRTLDLAGTNRARGWQPRINLGAYFYTIVTPHPARWKSGIKLLHHVVDVRKNDPMRRSEAMGMLANYYLRYLEDYPRAAYWNLKNTQSGGQPTLHGVVGLAECYFHLGNKQMAAKLLSDYSLDTRFSAPGAKLLAELGQVDKALKMSLEMARTAPDRGYLAAGNLHRLTGKYDQAITCYSKAAAHQDPRGHGKLNRQRARECLAAVKLCETLDISKVADGTHRGTSASYRGPLSVEVQVAGGKITAARVTKHKDDIFFTSITKIPRRIVETQSVERLDAVSGATVTCEAIVNAATKALSAGMR
ncbi:MAG: FMN-binding protein [Phycisphaerae bacterium]|nr:FMN-binding protein [Phycisphaerae bacterium]